MADIPGAYMQAVKDGKSPLVPYAKLEQALKDAGKTTYEEQLGYSIVHITKDGKHATSLKNTEFVAMPHVIARGNDKGLAPIMKKAGFVKDGLCKGRNEVENRKKEAARLAGMLWEMAGTTKVTKTKVAPAAEAPVEEAAAAQ